jgi:hypothetical protein
MFCKVYIFIFIFSFYLIEAQNNLFVKVVAGYGGVGYGGDLGPASSALLNMAASSSLSLVGIWVDSGGNMYIPEWNGGRIRKVDSQGIITTIAGTGAVSIIGGSGPPLSTGFNRPTAVVGNAAGTILYISESIFIWKLDFSANIMSVFAGKSVGGVTPDNVAPTSANLNTPRGLWLTTSGALYLSNNHKIRKIDGGIITSVAGSGTQGSTGDGGTALSAKFSTPQGIYVETTGKVFIADSGNARVRFVDTNGIIFTFAGVTAGSGYYGDNLPATLSALNRPTDVKGDSLGNIYITDCDNNRIRMVNTAGIMINLMGNDHYETSLFVTPFSTASTLNGPAGLWIDSQNTMYFTEDFAVVRKTVPAVSVPPTVSPTTNPYSNMILQPVAGFGTRGFSGDGGPATLAQMSAMMFWGDTTGNLYTADFNGFRIRKISFSGIITTFAGTGTSSTLGTGAAANLVNFYQPWSVVGDRGNNFLFISDQKFLWQYFFGNNIVTLYNSLDVIKPMGLWLTTSGALYVADSVKEQVMVFTSPTPTPIAGNAGTCASVFSGDGGPAVSGCLSVPFSVYVDTLGKVYIADTGHFRIRLVGTNNLISTFAGNGGTAYNGDNIPATSACLSFPQDVKGDLLGNIYIADNDHYRIRIVSPAGIMTTFTGTGSAGGSPVAKPLLSNIDQPISLWVDSLNNVYFSTGNNGDESSSVFFSSTIRKAVAVSTSSPSAVPVFIPNGLSIQLVGGGIVNGYLGDNGPATSALINPLGMWMDASGNLYSCEQTNRRVRKINLSGIVSTVAGVGFASVTGSPAAPSAVVFNAPYSIAGDSLNQFLYISDRRYIWQWSFISNIVSVIAGQSSSGDLGDNGPAVSAQLGSSKGIWLTTLNVLYIADTNNNRIRKISGGVMSPVAGSSSFGFSGDGNDALHVSVLLYGPSAVFVDTMGKIFIADSTNNRIRWIDSNNIIRTYAGTGVGAFNGDNIPATLATINNPSDVKGDLQGNIYVTVDPCVIRMINVAGIITSFIGTNICELSTAQMLPALSSIYDPQAVWVDTSSNVYFSNSRSIWRSVLRTPSSQPTNQPTRLPTTQPSTHPTRKPSSQPSSRPSVQPSCSPSSQPSSRPSRPTSQPSGRPTAYPSSQPFSSPSSQPTTLPLALPSSQPSLQPSSLPSSQPNSSPSSQPSARPSCEPTIQPFAEPSSLPSTQPTTKPTSQPISLPTGQPSVQPSRQPTSSPTRQPSAQPSCRPTRQPSSLPTSQPSRLPSSQPSLQPSVQPTTQPIAHPSSQPSVQPSSFPSSQPSAQPIGKPSGQPTSQPTDRPTRQPSSQPTEQPSTQPSEQPSKQPTSKPTRQPTAQPSSLPSSCPSVQPTSQPSGRPSTQPSALPSNQPTVVPSSVPSRFPSAQPSAFPSSQPSSVPTKQPTSLPTSQPSEQPTNRPSSFPSSQPTSFPTVCPSTQPTNQPTGTPSSFPSAQPSTWPTTQPTSLPTNRPTSQPSCSPSQQPSSHPTCQPSSLPSGQPTRRPSCQPSGRPSAFPSVQPTALPSAQPTEIPSSRPSSFPTRQPTTNPTTQPSGFPSSQPSSCPSIVPSIQPSSLPTTVPSSFPSSQPTSLPSTLPSSQPTVVPSSQPSRQPSTQPTSQPFSFPSSRPTSQPSSRPSTVPSIQPSSSPSRQPNSAPSSHPSTQPTTIPTAQPFAYPTFAPVATIYESKGVLFYPGNPLYTNIPTNHSFLGTSYILFGRNFNHESRFPSVIPLSSSAAAAFVSVINDDSGGIQGDITTRSTTVIGDINGDGFNELMVGYPLESRCDIYLGNSFHAEFVLTDVSIALVGDLEKGGGQLGWASIRVGDLNHDGLEEIMVSAIYANIVYVLYGKPEFPRVMNVNSDLLAKDGFMIIGSEKDTNFGVALALVHDFNKDQFQDIAISAIQSSGNQNVIYLLLGNSGFGKSGIIRIDQLIGSSLSLLKIVAPVNSFAGFSLAGIGDINNDGYNDLAIGSVPSSSSHNEQATYLIYGKTVTLASNELVLIRITKDEGFIITGGGFLVQGVGDVNNDGVTDVMITSYSGWKGKGNAYLITYPTFASHSPTAQPSSLPSSIPSLSPSTQAEHLSSPSSNSSNNNNNNTAINSTHSPSRTPTVRLTSLPTLFPSSASPTVKPTLSPTMIPTLTKTAAPVISSMPTTRLPTLQPTTRRFSSSLTTSPSPSSPSSFIQSFSPTIDESIIAHITCSEAGSCQGEETGNNQFLISATSGTIRITGNSNVNGFGKTRNIYIIAPPSAPTENLFIVIRHFNISLDIIDLSHLSEIGFEYMTIEEISFSNINPLSLLFCNNKIEVILPTQKSFDLQATNFVFTVPGSVKANQQEEFDRKSVSDSPLQLVGLIVLAVSLLFCVLRVCAEQDQEPEKEDKKKNNKETDDPDNDNNSSNDVERPFPSPGESFSSRIAIVHPDDHMEPGSANDSGSPSNSSSGSSSASHSSKQDNNNNNSDNNNNDKNNDKNKSINNSSNSNNSSEHHSSAANSFRSFNSVSMNSNEMLVGMISDDDNSRNNKEDDSAASVIQQENKEDCTHNEKTRKISSAPALLMITSAENSSDDNSDDSNDSSDSSDYDEYDEDESFDDLEKGEASSSSFTEFIVS